jgi:hypothetical protein
VGAGVQLVQISVPLVQISILQVQISILQVQLHPGRSRPPSGTARKCDTAQHCIFKILKMLTTLKNKSHAVISRTNYQFNKTISRPLQSCETIPLRGQSHNTCFHLFSYISYFLIPILVYSKKNTHWAFKNLLSIVILLILKWHFSNNWKELREE